MNAWIVETNAYDENLITHEGSKFLIGNGYFGIRGTLEEYTKEQFCAINMAGIYDRVGDKWRESVNAPNVLYTVTEVDGARYALPQKECDSHYQQLDFYNAIHSRKTSWKTDKGLINIESEKFAHIKKQHIIAMRYKVKVDYDCEIIIKTGIDKDVWDINGPHFNEVLSNYDSIKTVKAVTGEKKTTIVCNEYVRKKFDCVSQIEDSKRGLFENISFQAEAGKEYEIEKIAAIYTTLDEINGEHDIKNLLYDELKKEHIEEWENIWFNSKIEIDGDDNAMMALNYSVYQMNSIAPRNFSAMSIPARGLSAQVYKGAVFWDTEMFMIDLFIHTAPEVARTLINYRIKTLNGARKKATEYNLEGAYYAWESQEDGSDACSDYNITDVFTNRKVRTYFKDKQYHISSAVVYAIYKYIQGTDDYNILREGAAEVIIECAKMYRSLLVKKADSNFYEIRDVVGPDEYHERVNNDAYTNKMAAFVFKYAADIIDKINGNSFEDTRIYLNKKFNLKELKRVFVDSYENLFIPNPDSNSIIEQFDGYYKLEDVDIKTVYSRKIRNDEYLGGGHGVASDTQIIKQADVVAMLAIFSNDYDKETLKKNFDFYEPRTEHGSSLSACMYSLLACKIDRPDEAYPLFMKSAEVDLKADRNEWSSMMFVGGTHPASEGGSWIVAINGFAGVYTENGVLKCNPKLPSGWNGMRFNYIYQGKQYKIEIYKNGYNISLICNDKGKSE